MRAGALEGAAGMERAESEGCIPKSRKWLRGWPLGHVASFQRGDLLHQLVDRALEALELVPHFRQLGNRRQADLLLALRCGRDAYVTAAIGHVVDDAALG